jgi:hypothetical protein
MVISQTRVDRTAALVDGWARLNGQILRIAVSRRLETRISKPSAGAPG